MAHFWTVQDANGIYQFDNPGAALAALLADLRAAATLTDPSGFRSAGVSIQGVYSATQSFAIVLTRPGTDDEHAVVVDVAGMVRGAPLGVAPLTAYLNHGWMVA